MMDRSIETFARRQREEQFETQRKKPNRLIPSGSARGLDAFFEAMNDSYYQEDGEEDSEEDVDSDTEVNDTPPDNASLDDNMDDTTDTADDMQGEDTDNKAPVETDGINGTIPEETEEDEDTETPEETPTEDDNEDDMSTFGQHGGDDLPNNQYDPNEVAKVMEFVADEAKALSDYLEAAKTSKVDILQRLYSDIADEERYHMEQLLFAKAEITGEEYKPRDPDIRKEYEELLAMGMDEGSAMATAVDKFNLHVTSISKDDAGNVEVENKEIQEAVEEMERGFLYMETVQFVLEYSTDDYITEGVMKLAQPQIFQEEIATTADRVYSRKLSGFNLIVGAFTGIIKLIRKVTNLIRSIVEKTNHRIYALAKFVKNRGIGALFKNGVMLYLWNDRTSSMEIEPLMYFANMAFWLTQEVVKLSEIRNGRYANVIGSVGQIFQAHDPKYQQKPPALTCLKRLQQLDLMKTKVVVTQQNAAGVANLFFDSFPEDEQQLRHFGNGIENAAKTPQGIDISSFKNYFCILDIISQTVAFWTDITNNFVGELEGLENDNNSIYRTKIKVYNNCVEYMKVVTKSYSTLAKVVAADIGTLNQLVQVIQNA